MNKLFRTALVLAFLACASSLLIVTASAQSVYGSVFGTVSDKSGAVIPNATITVTDEAKGTVVNVTSNGSGDYSVPHLIPDVYDLKVVAKGFKPFETKGIKVEADTAPRIDPTMDVGSDTGTTVEVNAESQPELKTDKADVSTVFDQQQVSSLPVGDQNFTNLQLLLPGAQLLGWSHAADENPQGSKQIQVDGQAFGGTAFELDGTDNQDPILGIIVINPALDAVTETKITTQNFDAELGKAVSAVVTAQTKSGTNKFHGSAYDFRTGNANYARDPYSQPVGSTVAGLKNRFGGSIGGPVIRDRFFFFGNYEAQRQKVGTSATDTLPTALLTETALGNQVGPSGIAGADLSEYLHLGTAGIIYNNTGTAVAPGCGSDGKVGSPFPCNVIPTAMLSPQTLALVKYIEPFTKGIAYGTGVGNDNGLDSNYSAPGTGLFNSNSWTERADYTINEKMHAFERFSRFWDTLSGAVMFGAAGGPGFGIGNYGGNSNGANDSLASGMDIALNSHLLTDFRLGYYRYNVIDTKHDQGTNFANTLGIPGINIGGNITSGSPGFNITNLPNGSGGTNGTVFGDGLNINRCNCPLTEREDQFQIVNNWTMIKGNHTFKVGADLRYGRNLRVPSDNDRAGLLNFNVGPTSQPGTNSGGLGFASFFLGDVTSFNRYVSTSTNAKEFQKRTFFYGQDTWRVTKNLTLNLGLRWEIYFPESVNGPGNGALLDLNDGYLHVAGIGQVPSDLGWSIDLKKQFAPRLGVTYQLDEKTVVRAGYGRSFDTGVFGSIFGHTVTQNLPVLANQQINSPSTQTDAFNLSVGPVPYVPLTVPASGLLPNPGSTVSSSARAVPLNFPTIDAWNLAVQRALTPTLSLTVAYVGNKGTHTLGDGDSNGTNPNESFVNLPGSTSVTGQTLHYDPSVAANVIDATGATSTTNFLQRYYGGSLAACRDSAYTTPSEPYVAAGMCGWTNSIAYRGDTENTEFDALQVTLAQQFSHGLAVTGNYQWANAFGDTSNLWTWSHSLTHLRDSQVRAQQLTTYGSYDLPFGKGKQLAQNVNGLTDEIIGGYQLSFVTTWSGGLPFTASFNECSQNVPGTPNPATSGGCAPNVTGHMKTKLTPAVTNSAGKITRTFYQQQIPCADTAINPKTGKAPCTPGSTANGDLTDPVDVAAGTGLFTNPGLDNFGNGGLNTYKGPTFFGTDMAITKAFTIHESIVTKFRMDAFNAFNHITAGNPGGGVESTGTIGGEGGGCGPGNDCGPRQLEFSLRVQF
jgi:hypothetical protein